jgi:hypothetical protein
MWQILNRLEEKHEAYKNIWGSLKAYQKFFIVAYFVVGTGMVMVGISMLHNS